MQDILERRLNAQCKGLLEVTSLHIAPQGGISNPSAFLEFTSKKRVDFLHRTVRDFLRLSEVQALLKSRLLKPFDPNLTLCEALLNQANGLETYQVQVLEKILDDLTYYASEAERLLQQPQSEILDRFPRTVLIADLVDPKTPCIALIHPFVIQKGLYLYMQEKLTQDPGLLQKSKINRLLESALISASVNSKHEFPLQPRMVQILLENGANPNLSHSLEPGFTTWNVFLRYNYYYYSPSILHQSHTLFEIFRLLLLHNASQDETFQDISGGLGRMTVSKVIDKVFRDDQTNAILLKEKLVLVHRRRRKIPKTTLKEVKESDIFLPQKHRKQKSMALQERHGTYANERLPYIEAYPRGFAKFGSTSTTQPPSGSLHEDSTDDQQSINLPKESTKPTRPPARESAKSETGLPKAQQSGSKQESNRSTMNAERNLPSMDVKPTPITITESKYFSPLLAHFYALDWVF